MNRAGCDGKPCEKYPGSIAHRAQKLHEYLAKGRDGRPRLIFFRSCTKIIQAVPAILRNPDKPEEFNPHDELIHAIDSLTNAPLPVFAGQTPQISVPTSGGRSDAISASSHRT